MDIRSFLAFELPPGMAGPLSDAHDRFRSCDLDVRWVKKENIHLTVVFLGSVPEDDIEKIAFSADRICRRHSPFEMRLDGAGIFPGRGNPRVIWIGLNGDLERMGRFRDEIQEILIPFGVRREKRAFRPHLTIGRFRKACRPGKNLDDALSRHMGVAGPTCMLDKLVFFRSELCPQGAKYTSLFSWPLGHSNPDMLHRVKKICRSTD